MKTNVQKLIKCADKMGISLTTQAKHDNKKSIGLGFAQMLDISKPNRPEVREHFQKQLEAIK